MMDAMSGVLGGLAGALPLTTMSQNNGLIKMSGLHDCPSVRPRARTPVRSHCCFRSRGADCDLLVDTVRSECAIVQRDNVPSPRLR